MALIDELLVGLGFEYDPKDLNKFKAGVERTTSIVKNLAKVTAAAATAITGMTVASARASDEQGKLADEIGETVENVSALQFAQQIAGGTADGMANSLRELSLRASEAARGTGTAVEAFGLLGISVTDNNGRLKSTTSILEEVSGRMQGLDRARQIELADKLGLRDSIRLLQDGPQAIRELRAEAEALGLTTAEDAKLSADFNDTLFKGWAVVKQGTRLIARELMPVIRESTEQFVEWWKVNKDIIAQNLPEWIEKLTMALKVMSLAIGALLAFRVLTHIAAMISLMKGLTLATLATNAAIFLLPALIGLAIAAIALLAEDAKVFFKGGDSFIGDMIKKYPQWEGQIRTIAGLFNGIATVTGMIFEGWSQIIGLVDKFSLDNIKEVLGNLPGFLGDLVVQVIEALGKVTGISISEEGPGGSAIRRTGLMDIPLSNNRTSNSTQVERLEINVNGAGDNAENIANEVFRVFQQTSQDLNSTVDQ